MKKHHNMEFRVLQGFAAGFSEAQKAYDSLTLWQRIFKMPLGEVHMKEPHGESRVYYHTA